jgi:hypothetical protein
MLRSTVIFIVLAATSLALPQEQSPGRGMHGQHDYRFCTVDDAGMEFKCFSNTSNTKKCAAQACQIVPITRNPLRNGAVQVKVKTGFDLICNVWNGQEYVGSPIKSVRPNTSTIIELDP